MGEQINQFKNEYAAWYMSIDPTLRGYFDEIFRRHPETVFEVFTGTPLQDGEVPGGSTLSEVLNPEGAFFSADLVPYFDTMDLSVEPAGPEAATKFTIRWTDTNKGAASQGHADQVRIENTDTSQIAFESDRIDVEPLGSGASAAHVVTVEEGLPPGNYQVTLVLNVDGAFDMNDATGDRGLRTEIPYVFGVGGFDPSRPSTPERANLEAVGNAAFYLGSINNTGEEAKAQEYLALALESYAGVLPMGLTEGDDLMPRVLQMAQTVRGLEIADPVAFQQAISADADATAQVMSQVTGLSMTPAAGGEAILDFADKAVAAAG
jgi:hypothetical protein